MARTLAEAFDWVGGSPAPAPAMTPAAPPMTRPPGPMPASMRPPAPGMPDHRRLSERLGWGDNPIYRGLTSPGMSDLLTDLGYGLLNGRNFGQAMQLAGNRAIEMRPYRQDQREEATLIWCALDGADAPQPLSGTIH